MLGGDYISVPDAFVLGTAAPPSPSDPLAAAAEPLLAAAEHEPLTHRCARTCRHP